MIKQTDLLSVRSEIWSAVEGLVVSFAANDARGMARNLIAAASASGAQIGCLDLWCNWLRAPTPRALPEIK